ncbi:OLC1v1011207C1 [Oldenlandia corymbosa var. corymbosa]|uniref:OLC1v1011207C1 n=1 Tax=Oldenlandia corymbosa var. corymbosa TaxID=529605 RepID=A0AAV1DT71_OLDCO|nr:OLC1v1011207C1 [Oldenlandia corymbosa var. corymbosa]
MASTKVSDWAFLICFFLFIFTVKCDVEEIKTALSNLIHSLTNTTGSANHQALPWNLSSLDPCGDDWKGVTCDKQNALKNVTLNGLNLSGTFDPSLLCDVTSVAASVTVISLDDNNLMGDGLEKIVNCTQLTRLSLGGNQFSGRVPESFSWLKNLKLLDISRNNFSGSLPDLSKITGLVEFTAEDNHLSGTLPNFDFSNLKIINVSYNDFSGPIPKGADNIPASSFLHNAQLCGSPLPNSCQQEEPESSDETHKSSDRKDKILMFTGYFILGLTVLLLTIFCLCKSRKKEEVQVDSVDHEAASVNDNFSKSGDTPFNLKSTPFNSKSEISTASVENSTVSSSLVVLSSPDVNGIKFENLLRAPAELLGRGIHGSVYKVLSEELGMTVVVKRIKDWAIPTDDFKKRMRRLDRVQHPNVLSALAFYSSKQEKLLVYEYQQNGSLFNLLYGTLPGVGRTFDWSSRLDLATRIADGLAFMHQELQQDGIPHGNLKSSNILLSKNMEPYVSEYGLMIDTRDPSYAVSISSCQGKGEKQAMFKADVYAFGVILLELLTGKLVQNEVSGLDLAGWVVSVVREEWTVEVFDKKLLREGANEERMVNLLQIAIKCVNRSHEARPNMKEIAQMLNALVEDEEKSFDDVSAVTSTSIFDFEKA